MYKKEHTKVNITTNLLYAISMKYISNPIKRKKQSENINGLAPAMDCLLPRYGIKTKLQVAHFLAQTCHETAFFLSLTENPREGGREYDYGTEKGKKLGNTQKGDGEKYIGRGLFHLTGKYNYTAYGELIGEDLKNHPEKVAESFIIAVKTACKYWEKKDLSSLADKDNIDEITYRINGGYNGLSQRKAILEKAKKALGI